MDAEKVGPFSPENYITTVVLLLFSGGEKKWMEEKVHEVRKCVKFRLQRENVCI